MKRGIKNLIILLFILVVLTALLPIISHAGQNDRFLGSGKEILFNKGDAVSKKAMELVKGKRTTEEKAMAIYSYIVTNFKYDWDLYDKIVSKQITRYTPDPNSILSSRKGICYDIASLYAAMCRSVGIPAKMIKGDSKPAGGYHAWNSVYDDAKGKWIPLDLTTDMCYKKTATSSWRVIRDGYNMKVEL